MTEIAAFTTAVSHAINIAKAIVETRDETKLSGLKLEFSAALLELHHKQLSVAQDYQAVLDTNEAIKKQLAAYERWEQESQRYQLHQLSPGILVYALKPEHASAQPTHWLCAACFDERKKSVLQRAGKNGDLYNCPRDEKHQIDLNEYS